ncbi:MAG TPA: citrate synthase [Streptosporangiaceae bacterium]|nr:citrate synthase [Streptosporangiaceae bacterium]
MAEWIGTAEAARRLGIKEASLYSYVSRGLLSRRKVAGARSSLFNAAEVESLARRGRPRGGSGPKELVIETALTEIIDDTLWFRGINAMELAARANLEDVAQLMWTGSLPAPGAGAAGTESAWRASDEAVAAGSAAQAALPAATLPLERLQVIVPALAATDPLRLHLDRPAVIAAGRCLIAGMVDCMPLVGSAPTAGTIAERLVSRLCPVPPRPGMPDVIRAALVLLADHELAASTLAARVAASVRADPYAVVGTGLGAVGGALHGGASFGAETMLRAAGKPADAVRAVGELLRRGERIPGFGHFVYEDTDPRAVFLMNLIRQTAPDSQRLAVAEAVLSEARGRALPAPNIDFALAVLVTVGDMIPGAGEMIFAVARAAGWLAHALEEYARNTPIRPRGIYTGPIAAAYDAVPG